MGRVRAVGGRVIAVGEGVGLRRVREGVRVREELDAGVVAGVGGGITFDQRLVLSAPEAKHGGEGVERSREEGSLLRVPGGTADDEGIVEGEKEGGEDSEEEEFGLPGCIAWRDGVNHDIFRGGRGLRNGCA